MLTALLHRQMTAFEQRYGYDMRYGHRLLDIRLSAFLKFLPVTWMSAHREQVPPGAFFAAKIVTQMHEDCGPCTQLSVRMAEEAGLPPATLRAILQRDLTALDDDTALGAAFAEAVIARDPAADALRDDVLRRWGERGLVSLALCIAAARVFPSLKYALGYGHACKQLTLSGETAAIRPVGPRPERGAVGQP